MNLPPGSVLWGASATTVILAVVAGLFILGSPTEERARRVDARRVADLQGIVAAADLYWTRHALVPASLDELSAEPGVRINISDPARSANYGYQPLDSIRYEMCASFERETEVTSGEPERNLWAHGSGRQCFQLEVRAIARTVEGQNRAPTPARDPPARARRPR